MTASSDHLKVNYVVDETGRRQAVLVPFALWKDLVEELELLRKEKEVLYGLKQACSEAKKQDACQLPEQCLDDFLNEL
ncbi:hypothetical protein DENIS_5134 [Desulfonema ishimotonii]|uniref:Prevent-host-death protein n=1 Tax=Desulfonema ishimotonii TaxID=45657 RepID=A0A401G4E9_9BACT|nr:hypothetical protein [Desulfonema ishimotonii]GBC64117.1 hypothetical protein DENIS_5134 [Desulfonema ishimotonii]